MELVCRCVQQRIDGLRLQLFRVFQQGLQRTFWQGFTLVGRAGVKMAQYSAQLLLTPEQIVEVNVEAACGHDEV